MEGVIPTLPHTPSWRGTQLKHRNKFTFLPLAESEPGAFVARFTYTTSIFAPVYVLTTMYLQSALTLLSL
jgi:hypothetical protein